MWRHVIELFVMAPLLGAAAFLFVLFLAGFVIETWPR